jgi:hypothetical protein
MCKIRLHTLDACTVNAHAISRLNVLLVPIDTANLHCCLPTVKIPMVYTINQASTSNIHHLATVTCHTIIATRYALFRSLQIDKCDHHQHTSLVTWCAFLYYRCHYAKCQYASSLFKDALDYAKCQHLSSFRVLTHI